MYKAIKTIQENKIYKTITISMILLVLSIIIMGVTFGLSSATLNLDLYKSYLASPALMLMNLIPILLLMSAIYIISNRLWLGYALTAFLFVMMGITNKIKLTYRDDPFVFIDLKLIGESIEMSKRYDMSLSAKWIITIIGLIALAFILKIFFKFKIDSHKIRIALGLSLLLISTIIFTGFYFDSQVYASIGDETQINKWIDSQQFQSRGLVYPFIYSIKVSSGGKLEGYNEEKAKEDLYKYTYKDIPEDKKVNIVSIMLEAYNDFSKFEELELDIDIYEYFHKFQDESLSGKLVTNVFAGGTINTERGFLTGYHGHPAYKSKTNAFPWYFKEQGYKTEAMHPITGSFYDRRNGNEYIGFENFDYYENKYKAVQESPLMDMEFFDFIIEGYEDSIAEGRPYFNYSLTYQNHGPYSDKKREEEYLKKKPGYNESDYNIANNYLAGIYGTNQALEKLINHFESSPEPVVLLLFGDHNPWLGKDNSAYNMLNINMDLGTVDGFENYYQTPYIIWANQKAKEVLDRDFLGEAPSISPNQLMTELFDYIGWEGNQYMQYLSKLKNELPVNHELYFQENGEFIPSDQVSPHIKEIWQDFRNVEYYMKTNFLSD